MNNYENTFAVKGFSKEAWEQYENVQRGHELTLRQLKDMRQQRDVQRAEVQRLRNGLYKHIESGEVDCPAPYDLLDLLEAGPP